MIEKFKKYQRHLLIGLIVLCMGVILTGGIRYVEMLRSKLQDNAVQNVLNVTKQQQQAFDNFIEEDQKRLHSYVKFFSSSATEAEEVQRQLEIFSDDDAILAVMCLDEGWFCSSVSSEIRWVDDERLEPYREMEGSGVRDSFVGMFTGVPKFGYYETFEFASGHRGLMQKTYERSKVSENFSLSFYNGQGYGYVINQEGDILLRSVMRSDGASYNNIFDALTDTHQDKDDIETFRGALVSREAGSRIFTSGSRKYVYTYVPTNMVENWYLLSIVDLDAITAETNGLLLNSQVTFLILALILVLCGVFVLLIWRTHQEMVTKDKAVEYQTQMFDIFTSYLANNTDDIYMMLDQETEELEYVSPNVERVLGMCAENVIEALKASDKEGDQEEVQAYYKELKAMKPGESCQPRGVERMNLKTGEQRYFLERAYCAILQGRPKRIVLISDRTRERKSQNSLLDALRMAQAANDAKSSFLSSVSHDIRTPMNAIIGFLALMRDEVDNPGMVMEYNRRIDAASQHLLGLINDVLDMNKIESGGTTLSVSEMDLAEVIDEINTIIRPQTKAKEQEFDIFVSSLQYEHLMGDKLRINQVLINLLSNAVKYTGNKGRVILRVEELPQVMSNYSRIRFTVSDNGLGMSEDYLKVIFDPFTREETKITHEIQGTGLGMAITKSLVDLMGGTIYVESAPGQGSTFTVELELRIQEREDDPKFWSDYSVARMIVADDDEEVCRNIVKVMGKSGVETDYTTDGIDVVQRMHDARAAGRPYDVILLDWKMPGLNGLETARRIRTEYSAKIPILLLTAYDWSEIEQEAIEIGVNHFMPKPFFVSTFKEAIRRIMGSMRKSDNRQDDIFKDKHILVVDDIEVNRIILVKILTSQGATCDVAANGQEAMEKFLESSPGTFGLVLMDVQMPVMDGYEATRAIRASSHPEAKAVPIIAMTANAFVDDVRDAIESGMDAHIAKPVQLDKLKSTIQQVLDDKAGQG